MAVAKGVSRHNGWRLPCEVCGAEDILECTANGGGPGESPGEGTPNPNPNPNGVNLGWFDNMNFRRRRW